jgi:hypothetical protein
MQENVWGPGINKDTNMRTSLRIRTLLLAGLAAALGLGVAGADDAPRPVDEGTLVVVDAAGKEQKLKSWKFSAGTRRLGWLADGKAPDGKGKDAAPAGPEALEFLQAEEVKYLPTVLTLIPLDRIRSIDFDNEKETMTVRVATGDKADADEVFTGATKYRKLNKVTLEAEVDKGDLGVAEIKYSGGVPKGIRGIRFAPPKASPAVPGSRPAVVVSVDGERKVTHKVMDLQPLYEVGKGNEKLVPTLFFKKTLKVDVAKLKKIVAPNPEAEEVAWQVTLKEGDDETLTLLTTPMIDGKPAVLKGLLGRVPSGYKLFPPQTVGEIRFDNSSESNE